MRTRKETQSYLLPNTLATFRLVCLFTIGRVLKTLRFLHLDTNYDSCVYSGVKMEGKGGDEFVSWVVRCMSLLLLAFYPSEKGVRRHASAEVLASEV